MKGLNDVKVTLLLLAFVVALTLTAGSTKADFNFGTPVNLGPNVNCSSGDVVAIVSADGCALYLASDRPGGYGGYDAYVATRQSINDPWGPAVNLGETVNSSSLDGPWSVSADGLSLYLNSDRPGGYGSYDLWVTTQVTTRTSPSTIWSKPVNLGSTVNSSSSDLHPNISSDGLSLYFASNRTGGSGPDDIYVTTRASVPEPWGTPVNLGPQINTPAEDFCPSLSPDRSTLYFASSGHGGYGYYDMWQVPIFSVPTCGDSEHPYPALDLNKDCRVDFADLALFLAHWLECTAPQCE
jgi:Tol biopolymer transport system component